MSSYRRSRSTGATFFFTVVTCQRQPILIENDVRRALHDAIISVRSQRPFNIHAWVLLPDHMHCIWELPPGDTEYGQRWSMIKRRVSRDCAHRALNHALKTPAQQRRREILFWQRRFREHEIKDDRDFERHLEYIHWNPVKHGYVERAIDWRFSTFHRYVRDGVYASNWGGDNVRDLETEGFGE